MGGVVSWNEYTNFNNNTVQAASSIIEKAHGDPNFRFHYYGLFLTFIFTSHAKCTHTWLLWCVTPVHLSIHPFPTHTSNSQGIAQIPFGFTAVSNTCSCCGLEVNV